MMRVIKHKKKKKKKLHGILKLFHSKGKNMSLKDLNLKNLSVSYLIMNYILQEIKTRMLW